MVGWGQDESLAISLPAPIRVSHFVHYPGYDRPYPSSEHAPISIIGKYDMIKFKGGNNTI